MPKHFYNQIVFDKKITPSMSKLKFNEIATQWLENYKKVKVDKNRFCENWSSVVVCSQELKVEVLENL